MNSSSQEFTAEHCETVTLPPKDLPFCPSCIMLQFLLRVTGNTEINSTGCLATILPNSGYAANCNTLFWNLFIASIKFLCCCSSVGSDHRGQPSLSMHIDEQVHLFPLYVLTAAYGEHDLHMSCCFGKCSYPVVQPSFRLTVLHILNSDSFSCCKSIKFKNRVFIIIRQSIITHLVWMSWLLGGYTTWWMCRHFQRHHTPEA